MICIFLTTFSDATIDCEISKSLFVFNQAVLKMLAPQRPAAEIQNLAAQSYGPVVENITHDFSTVCMCKFYPELYRAAVGYYQLLQ